MKEKSHKGQRHKGCGLCDREKRAGNGADRRPARDRRQTTVEEPGNWSRPRPPHRWLTGPWMPGEVVRVRARARALCAPMPRRPTPPDVLFEELLADGA